MRIIIQPDYVIDRFGRKRNTRQKLIFAADLVVTGLVFVALGLGVLTVLLGGLTMVYDFLSAGVRP